MVFHKLLATVTSGAVADTFTVIACSPENSRQLGQLIVIYADRTVDGQLEPAVAGKLLDMVETIVWSKPVTIWVEDAQGNKYRMFWDRIVKRNGAIVFGGGHISQPLVQMLALLDFEVTVIDDRPEFANSARFPGAHQVICENFCQVTGNLMLDSDTAVIIVTRGHRYDLDCLRAVMGSNVRYLGIIGSRKRIREIIKLVQAEGAPADLEKRLCAPIGLDLGAETPAEIALSIAAEVLAVFRNGSGRPLRERKEAF